MVFYSSVRFRAVTILSVIVARVHRGGVDAVKFVRERFGESKIVNFLYYRGLAFIRSTFIYDLMVTENHVVFRGVVEFIILIPYRIVRGTWLLGGRLWRF